MAEFEQLLLQQKASKDIIDTFLRNSFPQNQGESGADAEAARPSDHLLNARLSQLDDLWKEFHQRHLQLYSHASANPDVDYFTTGAYYKTNTSYSEAQAELKQALQMQPASPGGTVLHPNVTLRNDPSSTLRLTKLSPPSFDGDPMNWESFKERFTTMVKDVASIPKVHKLQHLLSCLEGDAAKAFKNTRIIAANFDVVWTQLLNRYDRTRARLENHLFHIISVPHAKRTASDLTHLIDTMRESIRALEDMGRPTVYWDDWFVYLTASKLDKFTREDWEKSIEGNDDFPTFDDLADFLERRAQSLRTVHGAEQSTASTTKPVPNKKSVAVHATPKTNQSNKSQPSCPVCTENHFLAKCSKFLAMNLQQRSSVVQSKRLCKNCLRSGHFSEKCRSSYRCQTCHGLHHTKLHQEQSSTPEANHHQSPISQQPEEHSSASTINLHVASQASPAVLASTPYLRLTFTQSSCNQRSNAADPMLRSPKVSCQDGSSWVLLDNSHDHLLRQHFTPA